MGMPWRFWARCTPTATVSTRWALRLHSTFLVVWVAFLRSPAIFLPTFFPLSAQDNATAVKWLEKAVQKNSAAGRNNLGYMYLHGQGVKRDIAQALALFTKAAAQGLPDAQHNLGELYFAGQGTPRDYRKAMHYFSLAAQVVI